MTALGNMINHDWGCLWHKWDENGDGGRVGVRDDLTQASYSH